MENEERRTAGSREENIASWLDKTIEIRIDRPMGSAHPRKPSLIYPINYGYIPGVPGGDGSDQDVYLMGVDQPVEAYTARVIGVIHRRDDVEDKLVAAPEGMVFTQDQIAQAVNFVERFFDSRVEALFEKSCGTILYTRLNGDVRYLLIRSADGFCGFPKGHAEAGEREEETALRETWEETSIRASLLEGFRREISYPMSREKRKTRKTEVYFLAEYQDQQPETNPGFEKLDYLLLPYDQAYALLPYEDIRGLFETANRELTRRLEAE